MQNRCVAIEIPTDQELRGTAALRRLVEAVVVGGDHDETDWVEWKSVLDLGDKPGCFHVARAVLGLANREPERAQVACGGLGYVIVGAEPGQLHGLATVDQAKLSQLVEPYLGGAEGPAWTPCYVTVEGGEVLVVTVEAPKPGDRMHTLRREYDKYRNGTIFVRKHGRTLIADASDIDALQRRLMARPIGRGDNLAVRVTGDVPLSWFLATSVRQTVADWTEPRVADLLSAAREVERRREEKKRERRAPLAEVSGAIGVAPFTGQQHAWLAAMAQPSVLSGFTVIDRRTLDEFEAEVNEWRETLSTAAMSGLWGRYVRAGHGVMTVEVENRGNRFFSDLEIEIHFRDEHAKGSDEKPEWIEYPPQPYEFGKTRARPEISGLLGAAAFVPPVVPNVNRIRRRILVEEGSVKVRWHVGDLRQLAIKSSDEIYLLVLERPPDGVLYGTWKATVRDVDGVLTGSVEVPVAEAPVEIRTVLDL